MEWWQGFEKCQILTWYWNISLKTCPDKNFFADFFHCKYTFYYCYFSCMSCLIKFILKKIGPHFVGSPSFHFKIYYKILRNTSVLGQSTLDFVSPKLKLHNQYCHSFHTWRRTAPLPQAKVIIVIDLFMAAARRSCGNLCMPFSAAAGEPFSFLFWHMIYACLQLGKVGRSISKPFINL